MNNFNVTPVSIPDHNKGMADAIPNLKLKDVPVSHVEKAEGALASRWSSDPEKTEAERTLAQTSNPTNCKEELSVLRTAREQNRSGAVSVDLGRVINRAAISCAPRTTTALARSS